MLILVSSLACVIGVVISMTAITLPGWAIGALGAAWGMVAFPMYSIAVAHANDYAEPSDYVVISSSLLMMYGIGAISGPFIASSVMTWAGPSSLYLFTAVIHAGFVGVAIVRSFRRGRTRTIEPIPFGDALAAAATASRVYEDELEQQAGQATPGDNEAR